MFANLFRIVVLICTTTIVAFAQNYTEQIELNWTEKTKTFKTGNDKELPFLHFEDAAYDEYQPQIPIFALKIDLRSYGELAARIINPVYAPLTNFDKIDLSNIGSFIELKTDVAFARKKPSGVVSFVPIRQNTSTGQYEKLISAEIQVQVTPKAYAAGVARNTYTSTSQLSQGNIYKFAVNNTGIHKLDYQFLKDMGIDVDNIDPRNIQLLGNGAKQLTESMRVDVTDDLLENAIQVVGEADGSFDPDDYILFYAVGTKYWSYNESNAIFQHNTNIYTDKSHYFIKLNGNTGKRIGSRASLSGSASYTTSAYDALAHHEEDDINLMEQEFALPPSGRIWYGESFLITRKRSFYFPFQNREEAEPINFYNDLAARSFSIGQASLTINNQVIATPNTPSTTSAIYTDFAKGFRFPNTKPVLAGQNITVDIEFSHPSSDAALWLNYITLHARCGLNFTGNQFPFRDTRSIGSPIAAYNLANANNVFIWDVTNPSEVIVQQTTGSGTVSFNVDGTIYREFIAFDGNQFFEPEIVSREAIPNQNLHGITTPPEAIFICHSSLREAADRLAAHRRSHSNMTVDVINVEDIYNEFSSGNQDITALRNFCRMLYSRETSSNPFTHVLLFGIGSFDYKSLGTDRNSENNPNLIPVYQTAESLNPIGTYTSDDYFTLLDSAESMSAYGGLDLAVGRLPAKDNIEANTMVDKIIAYDSDPTFMKEWKNRLVFVADDEDNNLHFNDSERVLKTALLRDSAYNIEKVYLDAYRQVSTSGGSRYPDAKNAFLDALFKGALVVNYLGHGGDNGWTQERIFTSSDVNNLSNGEKLPLFITATCSFAPHDDPLTVSAGELLLLNPSGGAVSLFTTVRVVIASHNERLVRNTFNVIFTKKANGQMPTTGEVMLFAKNNAAINPPLNSRKYALLGDPTMTLAYPKYNVSTTSINGQPTSNQDTIKALQKVTITGQVLDDNGNKVSTFNGLIYPTVFDKEDKLFTLGNDNASYADQFLLRKKIIFKGQASVTNGDFSFSFVVPKDINYVVGDGRISYYAEDNQSLDANGYYDGLMVGGSDQTAVVDNQGPEVLVYMNTEEFARGGLTDKNPTLLVKLYDENGINTVGNGIGHDLSGTVTAPDGSTTTYNLNDFYTSTTDDYKRGSVRYPLKNLPTGLHHVKVQAWDTYNNPGEGDTEFVVAESADLALKQVLNYPNPFTTSTNFQFEHNYPFQDLEVQVQVYTVSGRLIKTIQHDIYAETNTGYRVSDVHWDGLDDYGDRLAKGVYVYKIFVQAAGTTEKAKQVSEFQKLVILK